MSVWVLRLGHRLHRDERISTHCGLVARAFSAHGIIYSGERDYSVLDSIRKVVNKWGGSFEVKYEKNWRKVIRNFKGRKIHLTVYGLPIQNEISKIGKFRNILVIIGGEKVPSEVLELADYNISVTQQPHSEVASLALFLDRYFKGKELNKKFRNATLKIIPQEKRKKVIKS